MAAIQATIEAQELRLMQAWMQRDSASVRKLAAKDCTLVFGTDPPEVLDRPSFAAAIDSDFRCVGFRMGRCVVRRHQRTAWYTAAADLELKLGTREWSGRFLVSGLWQKHRIGGWKLVERSISTLDNQDWNAERIRRLQMWR